MESRIEDVEEIDTLIAELEISKGKGNLILCVVNSPLYRDRIIQTLKWRFTSKVVKVENGSQIISILREENFNGIDILMWIMPEEPNEDLLNTLNNFRELFYKGKTPNVMFYNQAFSESVIKKAPDFWRYRGNYYEFKEEERGLTFEALEVLTTPLTYINKEDLLRKKRINEYLLEKVRDRKEKSIILGDLGLIFYYLGELDKALEYYESALKLNEELELKERIAIGLGNIGIVYQIKGALDKALEYYESALKLNEELGNKEGIARNLVNIGIFYRNKGELDKALEYYESALKLDEELEDKKGMASDFSNIGVVYGVKEELDKALEYFEKASKLSEELKIKEGMAIQFGNIGNVYRLKGELDKALEFSERALKIFKERGNRIQIAQTLMNIGLIFVLKGKKRRALNYYLEAQGLAKDSSIYEDINMRIKILRDNENVKGAKQKKNKREQRYNSWILKSN
ncbi:Photosystem I assembly protein Ycf3 [uncultured archaeon]|nr:Photosystem I assembly protein Ycf3 [uncultured archaeon]